MKQQEREAEEAKKTETERKPAEENGNANPNPNPSGNANGGGEGSAPDQVVRFGPPQTWVAPGQQNGNGDGNKDQAKGNVGGSAPNAGMAWTEEQDAELRRMKGENGQWKAIATELGRHVHEVKSRWGQIKPPEEGKKEKKGKQRERQKDEEKAERTEESPTVATEPKKVRRLFFVVPALLRVVTMDTGEEEQTTRSRPRLHRRRAHPAQPTGGQVRGRQVATDQLAVLRQDGQETQSAGGKGAGRELELSSDRRSASMEGRSV